MPRWVIGNTGGKGKKVAKSNDELPIEERIEMALTAIDSGLSLRKAAKVHGIPRSTLSDRKRGIATRDIAHKKMQRLTPEEEHSLANWARDLHAWGWPARVIHLRRMAVELLQAKGDTKRLGTNWQQKFLSRFPDLKSKFIPPINKERTVATDYEIFEDWFELYYQIKEEYRIQDENTYNMDEKGCIMGVIGKTRCIISKHEYQAALTQCGNREWVTLIECASLVGKLLGLYVIFKGVILQPQWSKALKDPQNSVIMLSEKG
jgi:helix-turn-helix, Psq domain/Tc5 transposase DNA-binding domain